ncbi:MAG TPA: AraC family transcriptional regulator [Clostridiales bacterium]|nr:AraC family transcriptional regulator [Clostridiales bacterium]
MLLSKYRQVLCEGTLNLPGLTLFGHNVTTKAVLPMGTHIHDGCIEIVVVVKGNESYYVENRKFELSGGDVFVAYTDQPHRSGNTSQGVCEIIWFQIKPAVQENFLGLSAPFGDLIRSKLMAIDTHILKIDREGLFYLRKSFENFLRLREENRIYGQSLLISFLSRLLFTQTQNRKDDELIENIHKYIEENIYDVIKTEDICSKFCISLSGFKHKFKEYTGVTPRDYINDRKIQKAKELLQSRKSVTETAMQLSFNSSDYFSVVFKKYTAFSPTQFRKL